MQTRTAFHEEPLLTHSLQHQTSYAHRKQEIEETSSLCTVCHGAVFGIFLVFRTQFWYRDGSATKPLYR